MDKSYIAVIIGISVPSTIFLLIVIISCVLRRRPRHNSGHQYSSVNHGLDDEELEFKRMIEMQGDDIDGLFTQSESSEALDEEEFTFDEKDMDRLKMLDQYRSNLVAAATGSPLQQKHHGGEEYQSLNKLDDEEEHGAIESKHGDESGGSI